MLSEAGSFSAWRASRYVVVMFFWLSSAPSSPLQLTAILARSYRTCNYSLLSPFLNTPLIPQSKLTASLTCSPGLHAFEMEGLVALSECHLCPLLCPIPGPELMEGRAVLGLRDLHVTSSPCCHLCISWKAFIT